MYGSGLSLQRSYDLLLTAKCCSLFYLCTGSWKIYFVTLDYNKTIHVKVLLSNLKLSFTCFKVILNI